MAYIYQIIGRNIKKYRELNKLTLEKLSEKINISYQNLSKIENASKLLCLEPACLKKQHKKLT